MTPGVQLSNDGYHQPSFPAKGGDGVILAAMDMGVSAAGGHRDTALGVQVQALGKLHAQKARNMLTLSCTVRHD